MRTRKALGLSLVEVMVSLAVLALIALAIFALVETGSSSYNTTTRETTLEQHAREALERLSEELRVANPADSAWTLKLMGDGTSYLKFQKAVDFNNGLTVWGTDIEYFWEASMADANNNGIVDEGRLVRTSYDAKGNLVKAGVCDYLEPGGFLIEENGNVIKITVNVMMVDAKQKEIRKSVSTTVLRRNKAI